MGRIRILTTSVVVLAALLTSIQMGNATAQQGTRDCAAFASGWRQLIPLTDNGFSVLSGCYKDGSGRWFLPAGPDDLHLPNAPILTKEEKLQTQVVQRAILSDLDAFPNFLPQWMNEQIESYYSPIKRPGYGHFDPSTSTAGFQNQYAEVLVNYLQDPNREWAAGYVAWWVKRGQAAIPLAWCASATPPVCASVRNIVGADSVPWPWDLRDELTLAEFLKWAVQNGYVAASPTATSARTEATVDCRGVETWLNNTLAQIKLSLMYIPDGILPSAPYPPAEASFRADAANLEALAKSQKASDPPALGRPLNALLVSEWSGFASAFTVLADAAKRNDSVAWAQGLSLLAEPFKDSEAAFSEENRTRQLVGFSTSYLPHYSCLHSCFCLCLNPVQRNGVVGCRWALKE